MNRYDSISSMIWFLAGLGFILWSSMTLRIGTLRFPGPGFLPLLCGTVISILALIVFFQRKRKIKEAQGESFFTEGSLFTNIFSTIGILVFYAFVLERLGFILTTFLAMLFIFKQVCRRSWFIGILESSIMTGACYLIFGYILKVQFPRGLLHF